jgi:hypothetical protein
VPDHRQICENVLGINKEKIGDFTD